jgi:hypothetical protein
MSFETQNTADVILERFRHAEVACVPDVMEQISGGKRITPVDNRRCHTFAPSIRLYRLNE